jgi:hypothetical protein
MALWYLADSGLQAMGGQLTSTSLLTSVTAGLANVLGSWVEMFPAAPFPVSAMLVHVGKANLAVAAVNTQVMFDVGTGPNGSETPIVQDVAMGGCLAFSSWLIPVTIPVGTRIATRLRSLVASKATPMGMSIMGGGFGAEGGYKATTYGAVTSGSRGTILTAPTVVNTEAAWTVLSASTTSPMRWALVGLAAPNTATATAADCLLDIGVGGAGVEAAIISDISFGVSANEEINHPHPLLFPVNVPAGSRLVARYRGTSTAATASPSVTVTGIC